MARNFWNKTCQEKKYTTKVLNIMNTIQKPRYTPMQ